MTEPAWLTEARKFIGLKEGVGPADNPTIMGWAKEIGESSMFPHDATPWCGLFAGTMVHRAGLQIPAVAVRATAWEAWGKALTDGAVGAVLVFVRPGGGHVGFYVGEDPTAYHVLGGNQGDAVSIVRVDKARCVAIRWPAEPTVPAPGQPVHLIASQELPVSTNEA